MLKLLKTRGVNIGEGLPKIAVSITGDTEDRIKDQIKNMDLKKIDIVEWRADCFKDVLDKKKVLRVLKSIREKLKEIPIIFTFRTKAQGGNKNISLEEYTDLNLDIARSKMVDIIDIELFLDIKRMKTLIKDIKKQSMFTIASHHDFLKTPNRDEIKVILDELDSTADILKLAFMALSPEDVFRLMELAKSSKENINKPMIIISMGELGKISRVSKTNSSISFAALDRASAPGQFGVDALYETINYKSNNFEDR